jgi:hypothetical protein
MREEFEGGRQFVRSTSRLLGLPISQERLEATWELVRKNALAGRAIYRVRLEKEDDPYAFLSLRERGRGQRDERA